MSSRRWIVGLSLLAHAGLGAGVFISGVWQIEAVDREHKQHAVLGVMMLPEAAGSPAAAAPKVELSKQPKKRTTELTQREPVEHQPAKPAQSELTSATGSGNGSGEGSGSGSARTAPPGDACPAPPCDGTGSAKPPEEKQQIVIKDPPPIVPPTTLDKLFLSGNRQIHPPDPTKTAMLRDGRPRISAALKVCVSESGGVSSVQLLASSKYADYDQRLLQGVRDWRYQPYKIANKPVAACGVVTFIYSLK